jgi:hypothetical protein
MGGDVVPGIVVAGLLVVLVVWNPSLAGRLVREDSLVEWLQVVLALAAMAVVLAPGVRRLSAADIVFIALLAGLAASEIELDQRLVGMPVVDVRFFRRGAVAWPVQVLAGTLVIGAPLALLAYAAARWRDLVSEARDGVREGWLSLLVAGLVLMTIAQVWERELNHLLPLPKYFLEETLEVIGTMYLALAILRRRAARRWSPRSDGPSLPRTRGNPERD